MNANQPGNSEKGGVRLDPGVREKLEKALNRLPNEIQLVLFTEKGKNEKFNQATRTVLRAFEDMSSKIRFEEYSLGHKLAKKWNVEGSPTILFSPDKYSIRWQGAPVGEEGRTLVEIVFLVGNDDSGLSESSGRIIDDIYSLREIMVFVSPTCPYCPQQAVNAVRAAVKKPDLISVRLVDIQANPELAHEYDAHSVPMTYANGVLIGRGAQSEELFLSSLNELEEQAYFIPEIDAEMVESDLTIVGGGPAGLTAGVYAVRSGLETIIVERGLLGGQIATTPVVENYPGVSHISGKALVELMVSHALEYVNIFKDEEVLDIKKTDDNRFELVTTRRNISSRAILLATGASHKRLGIPGEDRLSGRGVSYCSTCDGPLFKGKKAIMVGGGNSAVTEALYLHHMGVSVTLVHRRDQLKAQEMLIKAITDAGIPVLWNNEVEEIVGDRKVAGVRLKNNQSGENIFFETDAVFVAIGYTPAVTLAEKIGLELTDQGYIKKDEKHRTSVPGIYSAGDVEGGYKQIVTAAGQGAEAAISIFEDLIHPYWTDEDRSFYK